MLLNTEIQISIMSKQSLVFLCNEKFELEIKRKYTD
jgi:hypothetical protein